MGRGRRLTSATPTNGSTPTTTYKYAGTTQDELVHQTLPTDSIDYVYGRTGQTGLPLLQSLTKGTQTVYLDYDATGTPQVFTTDTGVENFYVFDGTIGNVLALVNAAGVVTATYSYDPYGNYTTTTSTGSAAALNPYRTAGGLYDRTTGWIKYGQRWYNPATGRFTQQDSIERYADPQQGNRYAYAGDNPTNYIDPTGEDAFTNLGLIGLGLISVGLALVGGPVAAVVGLAIGIFTLAVAVDQFACDQGYHGLGCSFYSQY